MTEIIILKNFMKAEGTNTLLCLYEYVDIQLRVIGNLWFSLSNPVTVASVLECIPIFL